MIRKDLAGRICNDLQVDWSLEELDDNETSFYYWNPKIRKIDENKWMMEEMNISIEKSLRQTMK